LPSRRAQRLRERAQSLVEFALVLPILLFLMVGVIDLARVYMSMLSVESAAREAADYGAFGSQKWTESVVSSTPDGTEAQMERRACVAASNLPEYQGPDTDCANPRFSYALSTDRGATWTAYDPGLGCDDPGREPPCWVKVTLQYDFRLLVPIHIEALGTQFGLPESITFERSSVFGMTDLELEP
jgi:hypothetical protein